MENFAEYRIYSTKKNDFFEKLKSHLKCGGHKPYAKIAAG